MGVGEGEGAGAAVGSTGGADRAGLGEGEGAGDDVGDEEGRDEGSAHVIESVIPVESAMRCIVPGCVATVTPTTVTSPTAAASITAVSREMLTSVLCSTNNYAPTISGRSILV